MTEHDLAGCLRVAAEWVNSQTRIYVLPDAVSIGNKSVGVEGSQIAQALNDEADRLDADSQQRERDVRIGRRVRSWLTDSVGDEELGRHIREAGGD